MHKLILTLILVAVATPVFGQELLLTSEERKTLEEWIKDVRSYREWHQKNWNRVVWGRFRGVAKRRERPPIPAWLPLRCQELSTFDSPKGTLRDACDVLVALETNFKFDPVQQQIVQAQIDNEYVPNDSFWRRLHVDGPWARGETGPGIYGLIGMHVTLLDIGKKTELYLPPGFMLVSIPDGEGGREFRPAATVGVSFNVAQFSFMDIPTRGHLSLAKVFIPGGGLPGQTLTVTMVGWSMSFGR